MRVRVCGPRAPAPAGATVIDTTSLSTTWGKGLSPFLLGPAELYSGISSHTVENAWQYSKVYPCHLGDTGRPTPEYWAWAAQGWANRRAVRYPMGKGARPAGCWWGVMEVMHVNPLLGYVTARKEIYCPVYYKAAVQTEAFGKLAELHRKLLNRGEELWLWDFDGYDHVAAGMSLSDVLHCGTRKCGHGFVLAMMLEGQHIWEGDSAR